MPSTFERSASALLLPPAIVVAELPIGTNRPARSGAMLATRWAIQLHIEWPTIRRQRQPDGIHRGDHVTSKVADSYSPLGPVGVAVSPLIEREDVKRR